MCHGIVLPPRPSSSKGMNAYIACCGQLSSRALGQPKKLPGRFHPIVLADIRLHGPSHEGRELGGGGDGIDGENMNEGATHLRRRPEVLESCQNMPTSFRQPRCAISLRLFLWWQW
eukprot:7053551-Pyramimonas_sp.AAC.1